MAPILFVKVVNICLEIVTVWAIFFQAVYPTWYIQTWNCYNKNIYAHKTLEVPKIKASNINC